MGRHEYEELKSGPRQFRKEEGRAGRLQRPNAGQI